MDREDALKYIMKRYPDQKEIWGDYLQEVKKICPAKYWIMLPTESEEA